MPEDRSHDSAATAVDERLDVRDLEGPPFQAISSALDGLDPEESLLLVNGFEPEPLYDVLDQRGFAYDVSQVADGEWHVRIEAATDAAATEE